MKRKLSLMLAFVMILSICLSSLPINASAAETALKPLPHVGEVISGFKTVELGDMELANSKTVLFEHEKTGAKLLYIQNDDTDRSFDISFRTPAVDSTGANHVLEHISVSGSQKYPLNNLLFTVANQTYSTYINAFTSQNNTSYPVSSMSEAQLLKLTDVYLDCVFHPSIYTDKNIFSREAWRYEMADANSPLSISGTVYNEMKGALGSISSASVYNDLKTLFPDSTQSNVSGGDPSQIKNLTYDQIIKTHQTYYHPSNSLMILYGNLDYRQFLKMINDEYLSEFDKKDVKIDDGKVTSNKPVVKTFKYPVSATTNTKNASQIDYAYALTDVNEEDIIGLSILAQILSQEGSPLKEAFQQKQIGGNVSVSFDPSFKQPVLTFIAQNADENKSMEFKALVDSCVNSFLKTGFDKEAVDAMMTASLLSNSTLTEMGNLGINLSSAIALMWANFDNINYLNDLINDMKNISSKSDEKYFENLLSKYIKNNNHNALVTTIPEAGLAEKLAKQDETYLSDLKKSMSEQEINDIVNATKAYNEWNTKETDPEIVTQLQVVKTADLPEEIKQYKLSDITDGGVRMLSAEANVGETANTTIMLDTSSVPADKLHYLQLYSSLLGKLDTKSYSKEELSTRALRYLNGAYFGVSAIQSLDSNEFTPVLATSWMGVMGEYDLQLDTIKEIFLNTKLDNSNDILNVVHMELANIKAQFAASPISLMIMRNTSDFIESSNYLNYISGLDYYNFLIQLEKKLSTDPDSVLSELSQVRDLVLSRTGMITAFAGNKNYISKYQNSISSFAGALPAKSLTKQDYSKLPKPANREGIAVDTPVQYNMISATYDEMGTQYSGKYIPISLVINDNYITPKIRFGYGAYDNIVSFSSTGFLMLSYRDPNIRETFDVYKGLPDFVRNTNLTQEQLDNYILRTFSAFTAPSGELSGATTYINNYLSGWTVDKQLKLLHEIKTVTVQDIKDTSPIFENLLKNGAYSTVGSPDKLEANKDLYDSIISIDTEYSKTDTAITRGQFFEIVLAGVPNPLDIAKQQGLITADSNGNYNEDKKLSREELAVFIYKIIYKIAALEGADSDVKIADIDSASSWAKDRIKALVGSGFMTLDDQGNFNPKGEVTSSDVQTILNRITQTANAK